MKSTLLELYKSDKSALVYCLFILLKKLSPCLKVKVLQHYYVIYFSSFECALNLI